MKDMTIEKEVLVDRLKASQSETACVDVQNVACGEWAVNLDKNIQVAAKNQTMMMEERLVTYKKGVFGSIMLVIKRVFRRIVSWYLLPICDKQTRYNRHTNAALQYMRNEMANLEKDNQTLKSELLKQQAMLKDVSEELQSLKQELRANKGE